MRGAICAAAAVVAMFPVTASAATVKCGTSTDESGDESSTMVFTARAGETNKVTVRAGKGDTVIIRDTANKVVPKGKAIRLDAHGVRCRNGEYPEPPVIRLSDKNDRATLSIDAIAIGGKGDDRLKGTTLDGGEGDDRLTGTKGSDVITGGPGKDRVTTDAGDDYVYDGETDAQSAPDVYDGGKDPHTAPPEFPDGAFVGDTIDYSARTTGVQIDLTAGTTDAGDTLAGFEAVQGGKGDDRITGNSRINILMGGAGDDALSGLAEADLLNGEAGDDQLDGGDGDDVILDRRGNDTLACGAGFEALSTDELDVVDATCDALQLSADPDLDSQPLLGTQPVVGEDAAVFDAASVSGQVKLQLSGPGGEDFGSTTFSVPDDAGQKVKISVPLTAAARTALVAGTIVRVRAGSTRGYSTFMKRG